MKSLVTQTTSPLADSSALASAIRTFFTTTLDDTGRSAIITVGLALLGVATLIGAYSLIKTDWPEAYTDTETRAQEHIRVNPIRTYVIFRGGPVFLVCGFISVLTDRAGGSAWSGFWVLLVVYLISTTGRAVFDTVRHPRHQNWVMLMIYHALSMCIVILAGLLAVALRSLFAPIIPNSQELLISLWAGVFAALLASVARQLLSPVRLGGHDVVLALIRDVGPKTWSYLINQTAHDEKLQILTMAVVLAEVQQRPKWFRRLERLSGKVLGPGTYGVAQVAADAPITDKESIDLLLKRLDTVWVYDALEQGTYSTDFNAVCLSLNDDHAHTRRIASFYASVQEMRELGMLAR